jgi:hypothetical protein
MSCDGKDDLLPSYTESANHAQPSLHLQFQTLPSTPRGQSLLDQLTLTRTTHIQSVINAQILPLIEEQASFGISQTTIALLPSDISLPPIEEKFEFSFDPFGTNKAVEVIGYSSDVELKIVRLQEQMNRTAFWRIPAAIEELERVLTETLNANAVLTGPTRTAVGRSEFEQVHPKRKIWNRIMPSLGAEQKIATGNPEVGTRQMDNAGQVFVKVTLEEICLRTLSEFGLYDTLTRQCVIVNVDARC